MEACPRELIRRDLGVGLELGTSIPDMILPLTVTTQGHEPAMIFSLCLRPYPLQVLFPRRLVTRSTPRYVLLSGSGVCGWARRSAKLYGRKQSLIMKYTTTPVHVLHHLSK
jgi:hypothetical protein